MPGGRIFFTGLFLTVVGIGYLINTKFMVDSWLREAWDFPSVASGAIWCNGQNGHACRSDDRC